LYYDQYTDYCTADLPLFEERSGDKYMTVCSAKSGDWRLAMRDQVYSSPYLQPLILNARIDWWMRTLLTMQAMNRIEL
jgi:hypothetical protein